MYFGGDTWSQCRKIGRLFLLRRVISRKDPKMNTNFTAKAAKATKMKEQIKLLFCGLCCENSLLGELA